MQVWNAPPLAWIWVNSIVSPTWNLLHLGIHWKPTLWAVFSNSEKNIIHRQRDAPAVAEGKGMDQVTWASAKSFIHLWYGSQKFDSTLKSQWFWNLDLNSTNSCEFWKFSSFGSTNPYTTFDCSLQSPQVRNEWKATKENHRRRTHRIYWELLSSSFSFPILNIYRYILGIFTSYHRLLRQPSDRKSTPSDV